MKDLKAIKGRYYIQRLIEEGEHECQDFKYSVSDASKIAHSISAFANGRGGRLLIGVKDNGSIAGVRNEEDIFVIEQAASMYCRPEQHVEFSAYNVDAGTVVIVAGIPTAGTRPVLAREQDGSWRAYIRVADENITAHPLQVKAWKMRYDPCSRPVILRDSHHRLLDAIGAFPGSEWRDKAALAKLAVASNMSVSSAERAIIELASLGLLEFEHRGNHFARVRPTPTDSM